MAIMSVADLQVTSEAVASLDAEILVLGVQKTDAGPRLLTDDADFAQLADSLAAIGITGGVDEVRRLPAVSIAAKSLALVGVGSTLGTNELRYAAGSAARQLRGATSIAFALPTATRDDLLAVLEGAAIGAYSYTEFRSKPDEPAKLPATSITVVSSLDHTDELIMRASAIATGPRPPEIIPITGSPGIRPVTSGPASSTTPAPSQPSEACPG